jgi:uncharacterized protein YndB with AHSA1/START domain
MWFEMRKEDLGFLERAPAVHVAEATMEAPRSRVFGALTAPGSWKQWFPGVRDATYATPPPHGLGTIREARVRGTTWIEEVIAWDDGARFAWTVTRASVPLAHAQVEAFELMDAGRQTRVRWTLALEPRLLARLGAPLTTPTIRRLFHRAMANLDGLLHERG